MHDPTSRYRAQATTPDRERSTSTGEARTPTWSARRIVDTFSASIGLIAVLPVLLTSYFAVRLTSRGPVLRPVRIAQHGRRFTRWKFRSVYLGPSLRVTPVGRILRHLAVDELLLLVNVLKGDIGSRPAPVRDRARVAR